MGRPLPLALLSLFLLVCQLEANASPAERLAEAVRFKTISNQDRSQLDAAEFAGLNRFLRQSFPRTFAELEVETVNEFSLLLHWPGSDPGLSPILFTAHTDVVPVEPGTEDDWDHPAFDGVIADGRIYGRGTLDDKQGVLGLLEAVESLLKEGFSPARSVVFAFGHDEEVSGQAGAALMAKRMQERGWHFTWMVDEGGMVLSDNPLLPDRQMAMINVAEKGYLTLTLTVTGEGGHSSRPPKVSTIGRLSAALVKIENNPFPPRLVGPVEAMLETLGPYMGQPERFIFNNLWLTGGIVADQMGEDPTTNSFVRTTTALTMMNAGIKENVVPQRAVAKVNFRLLPGDTPEKVIEHIEKIVSDPLVKISYDEWDAVPAVADYRGGGYGVIAESVVEVYPDAVVVPSLLVATTDTRHYIEVADDQYRFHGVEMAADQAQSIHGTNEYIAIESYVKSIEVARQMIQRGAGR